MRLGFNYVKGFRRQTAEAIIAERAQVSFASIDDLRRRVPRLSKDELKTLADLGALNPIGQQTRHRRDALWQIRTRLAARGGTA